MYPRNIKAHTLVRVNRQLRDCLRHTPLGHIVRRRHHTRLLEKLHELLLVGQIHLRRQPAQTGTRHLLPNRPTKLVERLAEQIQLLRAGNRAQLIAHTLPHVINNPQHAHHRCRQNRLRTRLVIERNITARNRDDQLLRAVRQAMNRLTELPHHSRVLRGTKIQTVRHRHRASPRHRHIPVRLSQR